MGISISRNGSVVRTIDSVISAEQIDRLNGERMLSFVTTARRAQNIKIGDGAVLDGQVYTVSRISKSTSDGMATAEVECEHISYKLNDEEYDVSDFEFTGNPVSGLERILRGTGLRVGEVDVEKTSVTLKISGKTTRRNILMDFVVVCGGEIEYDGYWVGIRQRRGSSMIRELMDGRTVSDIHTVEDVGQDAMAIDLELYKPTDVDVGDAVHIAYAPYEIDLTTRVIGIAVNPFYRRLLRVEVGEYKPTIISRLQEIDRTAQKAEQNMSDALNKAQQALDETWDCVKKFEIATEIETYVNSETGIAYIRNALSGSYLTEGDLGDYVQKTQLNTSIEQYIDTNAGKAKLVAAVSGSFATASSLENYVKKTELNTSVGQYIDSYAGTAKIVLACSGTYLVASDLTGYAKTTAVTSVEQSVSDVEAAITLSSSYTENTIGTNVYALLQLVSNPNSSSIKLKADKIDFTGFTTFLRASDLGTSGTTTIDGGRINTDTLKIKKMYGAYDDVAIDASGAYLYIGGKSSTYSDNYQRVYIGAYSELVIGTISNRITADITYACLYPSFTSVTVGKLGRATNPWGAVYFAASSSAKYILAEDTVIRPSVSTAFSDDFNLGTAYYPWQDIYTQNWHVYYNSTIGIYATATSSGCTLAPTGTSSSRPNSYLGTSTVYWKYCYIGEQIAAIGKTASSQIGFFGKTPISQKSITGEITADKLYEALRAYGLFS